jgi:hypothetical protein
MIVLFFVTSVALLVIFNPVPFRGDWSTASRESANLAPLAHHELEAQVQIYSAKAFSWRGKFSVHTWLTTKEKNADDYLVYHVLLWGTYFGADGVVVVQKDLPDRFWYGAKPQIIFSASGKKAEEMIPQIYEAVKTYPYPKFYRAYPGPNSNTFISHILRNVKGFNFALPSNAIGKDWLCNGKFFALSESKSGVQFSLYGMLGIIVGLIEGIEFNIIGLSFGIDFLRPAIKLPAIGRVGFSPYSSKKLQPNFV